MDPAPDQPLTNCWTPWHDRLHRELLQHPQLLPRGDRLLVAVSGGQDSMALTGLLLGLRRLHGWDLQLWHGDHGWHAGSATIASELAAWCQAQGLPLRISHANASALGANANLGEAQARHWRYAALSQCAEDLDQTQTAMPCRRVVCAHTATDKAETLLLHLARGSDLAGLGSLRRERVLEEATHPKLLLVRPLLSFSRQDTQTICSHLNLPVWLDPSNADPHFSRNRIRQHVLPVLNDLHPGCELRMAALSERLSQMQDTQQTLLDLSLESLQDGPSLNRSRCASLPASLRRSLLARWITLQGGPMLSSRQLNDLSSATAQGAAPGRRDLGQGWRIHWDRKALQLEQEQ